MGMATRYEKNKAAIKAYYENNKEAIKARSATRHRREREARQTRWPDRLKSMLAATKSRAKVKGLAFDLDLSYLLQCVEGANYRCAATGDPLDLRYATETFTNPAAPSIDRIDSQKGYIRENVQITTYHYNIAKGQFSPEAMKRLAYHILFPQPQQELPE